MRIEMISTGDEIMTGFVTDTNTGFFASRLLESGLFLTRHTGVGDSMDELTEVFKERSKTADIVLVNGGLGPTTDDLTAEAASIVSGQPLEISNQCLEHLKQWQKIRGIKLTDNNSKQAFLPRGAEVIPNPFGTACGFKMKIGKALFYFTPGVPAEYTKMLDNHILPDIIHEVFSDTENRQPVMSVNRFFVYGISESTIGRALSREPVPDSITIGYRATPGFVEIKAIGRNATLDEISETENLIIRHAGDCLIGAESEDKLFSDVKKYLTDNNKAVFFIDNVTQGRLPIEVSKFLTGRCIVVSSSIPASQNKNDNFFDFSNSTDSKQSCFTDIMKKSVHLFNNRDFFTNGTCRFVVTIDTDSHNENMIFISFFDVDKKEQFKRKLLYKGLSGRKYLVISFIALDTIRRYLKNRDYRHSYPYFEDLS